VEDFDVALEVLQEFLLSRSFKPKATRTYVDHLKEEYLDLSCPNRIEVYGRPSIRKDSQGNDLLDAVGQKMPYIKYSWRPRVGQANYKPSSLISKASLSEPTFFCLAS
jgi:hypothetical protein